MLLAEKSWRSAPNYVEEFADESNISINHANYGSKQSVDLRNQKGVNPIFKEEVGLYSDFMDYLRQNGATKTVNDVEIMDTEKAEALLRQTPEIANYIDVQNDIYAQTRAMAEYSAYMNGRSFTGVDPYFPFVSRDHNNQIIDLNNVGAELKNGRMQPKMKSGATIERKYIPHYIEISPKRVMETYLKGIARNYHVYPELRKVMGAVVDAGAKALQAENESGEFTQTYALSKAILSDMRFSLDMHYKLNSFDSGVLRGISGKAFSSVKMALLANIKRVLPEFIANTFRATISTAEIPVSDMKEYLKNRQQYLKLIEDYIGEKYMSRWGDEISQDIHSNKTVKAAEDLAKLMITFSDTQVGSVLFIQQFKDSFKQYTGNEFDIQKYGSDFAYRMENEIAVERAATKGLRKVEELFNDKAPLSSATLKTFFFGKIKANPTKGMTAIFDFLQGYNRNEAKQMMDSMRRLRYGDTTDKWQAKRDMAAIVVSNFTYFVLRSASGVLLTTIYNSLTGNPDDEYTKKLKQKLATWQYYRNQFLSTTATLPLGGSQGAVMYGAKWIMLMLENSNTLSKRDIEDLKQLMQDQYYVRSMPKYGSYESIITSALPSPAPMSQDAFNGMQDISELANAIVKMNWSEKKTMAAIELMLLSIKYTMPNPVSGTMQPYFDKARKKVFKKKTGGTGTPQTLDEIIQGIGMESTPELMNGIDNSIEQETQDLLRLNELMNTTDFENFNR
jgi:hypothetical protein